ncbi:hypothetical protein J6590_102788 [Homalodisca vitripennis]|nr:hypothetical protein J6590_102788 [Homalodisca vitripennis]
MLALSPTDLLPMDTRTTPWEPCGGVDVSLTMQRVCDRRQTTSLTNRPTLEANVLKHEKL